MIIGGSLGAAAINNIIRDILPELIKHYQIIHICGKDKVDHSLDKTPGYIQFEYVKKELADLFALADVVISRAGANAICELLALRKPNILIPLSANASRGDQILNADSFEHQGFSKVIQEENLTCITLMDALKDVFEHKSDYIQTMQASKLTNSIETIMNLILEITSK